jgi:hypothetical protein
VLLEDLAGEAEFSLLDAHGPYLGLDLEDLVREGLEGRLVDGGEEFRVGVRLQESLELADEGVRSTHNVQLLEAGIVLDDTIEGVEPLG